MSNPAPQLVQKLWNYRNILHDDGLSYGDYIEQLTFLLFLKMADEQSRPPFNKPSPIPKGKDWPALLAKDGDELEIHYRHTLEELGKRSGMLGVIFRKAQNKMQDPAKLRRLIVDLISSSTGARRWYCRTRYCSKARQGRPSGANCSSRRTCIRCYACPPAFSTRKA